MTKSRIEKAFEKFNEDIDRRIKILAIRRLKGRIKEAKYLKKKLNKLESEILKIVEELELQLNAFWDEKGQMLSELEWLAKDKNKKIKELEKTIEIQKKMWFDLK